MSWSDLQSAQARVKRYSAVSCPACISTATKCRPQMAHGRWKKVTPGWA